MNATGNRILKRSYNSMIGGVCGGIAEWRGWPSATRPAHHDTADAPPHHDRPPPRGDGGMAGMAFGETSALGVCSGIGVQRGFSGDIGVYNSLDNTAAAGL